MFLELFRSAKTLQQKLTNATQTETETDDVWCKVKVRLCPKGSLTMKLPLRLGWKTPSKEHLE